jgi:hypothetical protein
VSSTVSELSSALFCSAPCKQQLVGCQLVVRSKFQKLSGLEACLTGTVYRGPQFCEEVESRRAGSKRAVRQKQHGRRPDKTHVL